ncbi:MAG TPA: caspase family protein, partial [Ferruginibacter sp.]|nr:caspase family protein [Ferruginibacter sp.]
KRIKKLGIDTTAFRDGYSVPEADFVNRDAIEYEIKNENLTLRIKGNDNTYKLDRFNIWVNEVPVYGQRGISLRTKHSNNFDSSITIKLSQGENRIETSVSNVNGTESYRMPLIVNYTPAIKQKEKTYFIGIGIDRFVEKKYNLQYSVKDIRDLSKKLKEKYGNDIVIDTLFNENVTGNNVIALKKKLLQTTENDKVIIAYSGHGMLSKDYDYYLSTYAVNFENPVPDGLPYDELESLLDSIPARKKLMLIDACHSGEVDKEELEKLKTNIAAATSEIKGTKGVTPLFTPGSKKLGIKNSFELMQQLFVNVGRSTGATVISAAGGTQFALERGDLKNGVFTYSILEFMKDHPTATIAQLKTYVNKRVPELTKGIQVPTSGTETNTVNWNIW